MGNLEDCNLNLINILENDDKTMIATGTDTFDRVPFRFDIRYRVLLYY